MLLRWVSTVRRVAKSVLAISRLPSPSAVIVATRQVGKHTLRRGKHRRPFEQLRDTKVRGFSFGCSTSRDHGSTVRMQSPRAADRKPIRPSARSTRTMAHPIVYFEIVGQDADSLRSYYAELFGWRFAGDDSPRGFEHAAVAVDGAGIAGAFGSALPGTDGYLTFYVAV